MGDSLPPFRAVPFKPFVGPNQAAKRPCRWRHLEVWCLRRMRDPAYGAENNMPLGDRDAAEAMPLTNAGVLAHCAKTGRNLADVLCEAVQGRTCTLGEAHLAPPVRLSPAAPAPPPAASRSSDELPRWDSDSRVLTLGGRVVKQFRQPAEEQDLILTAFQEEGWPQRISDPLPPKEGIDPKQRLHSTIRRLNRHQKHKLITFHGNGTGDGIGWSPVAETVSAEDTT